ncbi:hypothetical protein GCM10027586_21220 [Kineococcus gypseus]
MASWAGTATASTITATRAHQGIDEPVESMPAITVQNKAATSKSLTHPLLLELFAPGTRHRCRRASPQAETAEKAAAGTSHSIQSTSACCCTPTAASRPSAATGPIEDSCSIAAEPEQAMRTNVIGTATSGLEHSRR